MHDAIIGPFLPTSSSTCPTHLVVRPACPNQAQTLRQHCPQRCGAIRIARGAPHACEPCRIIHRATLPLQQILAWLLRCFLPSQGRSRRFTVFVSSMNPSRIQIKPKILTHKPKCARLMVTPPSSVTVTPPFVSAVTPTRLCPPRPCHPSRS